MHDLFDILGLPTNALPSDVRRAYARRPRRFHPDFHDAGTIVSRRPNGRQTPDAVRDDIAIDFVDLAACTDRMQAAFFADGS